MQRVDYMEAYFNKMLNLAQRKLKVLQDLMDITNEIRECLDVNNYELLNKLIEKKQKSIDDVEKIDLEFVPLYNRFKKQNKIESIFDLENRNVSIDIKKLKGVIIDIKSVLDKIKEQDDKNLKKMQESLEKVESKIEEFSKNKNAYIEYMKYYTPDSYFIDKLK